MKKRRIYSGSFKFNIVVELLKGEKTLEELARQHNVHPNQIKNWKTIFLKRGSDVLEDRRKRKDIKAEP